jgi:glutaredoxin
MLSLPLDLRADSKLYLPRREEVNEMTKRQVEVFTAGCPICDPAVQLVQELASSECEVTVHNLRESGIEKARQYGITRVPTVVVDGTIAACCGGGGVDRQQLQAAGIGLRLS